MQGVQSISKWIKNVRFSHQIFFSFLSNYLKYKEGSGKRRNLGLFYLYQFIYSLIRITCIVIMKKDYIKYILINVLSDNVSFWYRKSMFKEMEILGQVKQLFDWFSFENVGYILVSKINKIKLNFMILNHLKR